MPSNRGKGGSDVWGVVADPDAGKSPFAVRVLRDNELIRSVRLEMEVTYIGRMPENHVVLDDEKVSRSHARIIRKGAEYIIEDQESVNGIYVNGKRVKDCILKTGVLVGIGDHVLEVVHAQADDREAARESQLDRAEEEAWRMDQTISGVFYDQVKKKMEEDSARRKDAKKFPPPKMTVKLEVGGKKFDKTFEISQARERKDGEPQENCLEIRIYLGKWVLSKKEPL